MRYVAPARMISGNWSPGGKMAELMMSLRKGYATGL